VSTYVAKLDIFTRDEIYCLEFEITPTEDATGFPADEDVLMAFSNMVAGSPGAYLLPVKVEGENKYYGVPIFSVERVTVNAVNESE